MDKIVSYEQRRPEQCVNWDKLKSLSLQIDPRRLMQSDMDWSRIIEIHIIGSSEMYDGTDEQDDYLSHTIRSGIFISKMNDWLICIGQCTETARYIFANCSDNLKKLDVRFTQWSQIDVGKFNQLDRLNATDNSNLIDVVGISNCNMLRVLNVSRTKMRLLPDLSCFPQLYALSIRDTSIVTLVASSNIVNLQYLDVANTEISDLESIRLFPKLKSLNIRNTKVKQLKIDIENNGLEILNCSHTAIQTLPNLRPLI